MSPSIEFPNGSVWRKWDLHIHSPLSLLNNQFPRRANGTPDWEAYISRLEQLDVSVVGITDYFTIDGYRELRKFKAAGRLQNIHTVLPNIEFRLKSIISSRKGTEIRLNLHVILSDEVPERDIEEHFLHDLHFYYQGDPQNRDEKRRLKVSNLEELGKQLLNQHEAFRAMGISPRELGAMQAVVDHEEIASILAGDSRFKGKYLIVLPADGWDEINWDGQAHVVRKGLLQKSDMVFSPSSNTREFCLGRGPYKEGVENFISEFATLKPCIHGSDAHNLSEAGVPCKLRSQSSHSCAENPDQCDLRFCWIKADPTFEGLKQLLYEPADRVAIQVADPSPLKSNYCITGFQVDGSTVNEDLSIAPTRLQSNTALVAVTGGKGAGKTALIDLVANFFVDRCSTSDPNSFVRRIVSDHANFKSRLTFGDGATFEKMLVDSRFVERSEIVYIAQGELERYIGDNSDLDRYIRGLIFESPHVKNTVKSFEFEELAKRVRETEEKMHQMHQLVERLEMQTEMKVLAAAKREKSQVEAELKDVESKIPTLESRLTKEKVKVIQTKQITRSGLQARKNSLLELGELLANARRFLSEDLVRFNSYLVRINSFLRELGLQGVVSSLEYPAEKNIEEIQKSIESELRRVVEEIEASEKELRGYESEMQEHAKHLDRRNELSTRLANINQRLEAMAVDSQHLKEAREGRDNLFGELVRTILQQQGKYAEIIEVFGSKKAAVLSDLDFTADVQFDHDTLLTGLEDILDNRQVEVRGDDRAGSEFKTLQKLYAKVLSGDATAIDGLVTETARLCEGMKGKIKRSQAISVGDLYKCLYGTYLAVVPVVTYKKTALNKLSLGQKTTVLIKIYLAQGTCPIIIDSHDDHLDNEFIMEELVGAIREAKTFRQVILASNNGNVVINSDAEQIVVAHREEGKISWYSGSIENPVIRDRALMVLEGGAAAFKKRQEKYRVAS